MDSNVTPPIETASDDYVTAVQAWLRRVLSRNDWSFVLDDQQICTVSTQVAIAIRLQRDRQSSRDRDESVVFSFLGFAVLIGIIGLPVLWIWAIYREIPVSFDAFRPWLSLVLILGSLFCLVLLYVFIKEYFRMRSEHQEVASSHDAFLSTQFLELLDLATSPGLLKIESIRINQDTMRKLLSWPNLGSERRLACRNLERYMVLLVARSLAGKTNSRSDLASFALESALYTASGSLGCEWWFPEVAPLEKANTVRDEGESFGKILRRRSRYLPLVFLLAALVALMEVYIKPRLSGILSGSSFYLVFVTVLLSVCQATLSKIFPTTPVADILGSTTKSVNSPPGK